MTTLTRYSPLDAVDSFFGRVSREMLPAFDRVLNAADGDWTPHRVPHTNINETDDAYILTLEMPGLSRKDVELTIEGDRLTVTGKRPQAINEKGLLHNEIRSTHFTRTYNLMRGVNRDNVRATMKNGLLTITLAKAPDQIGRRITVE